MNMILKRYEQIFALWMQREGYKNHHIIEEIERLNKCETLDDYKRVKRIGSTLQLNRQKRVSIWLLLENAKRHAMFEEQMKEAGAL